MSYRLQMSAEIHDWLTELRDSDPPTAVLAALALSALADAGDRLGPPLVIALASRLQPDEVPSALDRRYQAWLESTNATRRRVAEAATLRKDIERQLAGPEPVQAPAGLRERLAAAAEAEKRLIAASQREQMLAEAFRARKAHRRPGRTRSHPGPLPRSRPPRLWRPAGCAGRPGTGGHGERVRRRAVIPGGILPRPRHRTPRHRPADELSQP
jgi:hypothetical protein